MHKSNRQHGTDEARTVIWQKNRKSATFALYSVVAHTRSQLSYLLLKVDKAQSQEFNYTICGKARKLVVKETIWTAFSVFIYGKLRHSQTAFVALGLKAAIC